MAILTFPVKSLYDSTEAGRNLITAADVATQRSLLGLDSGDSPTFSGLTLTGNLSLSGNSLLNASIDAALIDSGTFADARISQSSVTQHEGALSLSASQVAEISNLTAAEGAQLENIDAVTITNTQWGHVGALDQGLATTDSPTFGGLTLTGDLDMGGNNFLDLGDVTFKTGGVGGTLRTGTSAADKFQIQAYDTNAGSYVTVLELDAGNPPFMQLIDDFVRFEDNADNTKIVKFDGSGISTMTTRTLTFPDADGTIMLNLVEDTTPQFGGTVDLNGNAGSDTQLLYNNGGNLGAISELTFDGTDLLFNGRAVRVGNHSSPPYGPITEANLVGEFSADVDDIAGVAMKNISTGTSADFRFVIEDTDDNYLAFSLPGVNNSSNLFGVSRSSLAALFTFSARHLALGTFTARDIIFGTGNSERARILGTGEFGIGTDSPDGLLNLDTAISGTPDLNGQYLHLSGSTFTDNNTAGSGTATNMVFHSVDQPTLAASNTSVTTTNAASFYIAGAPVAGTNQTITNAYSLWVGAGTSRFEGNLDLGGNSLLNVPGSDTQLLYNNGGNLGAISALTYDGTDLTFSGGNVGIGTSSPSDQLHVTNGIRIGDSSNGGTLNIRRGTGTQAINFDGSTGIFKGASNNAVWQPYDYGNANHYFNIGHGSLGHFIWTAGANADPADGTELMRLERDGNLGLGTTSPQSGLHVVNGDVAFGDGGNSELRLYGVGTEGDTNYERLTQRYDSGNTVWEFDSEAGGTGTARDIVFNGGNVGIGTSSPELQLHSDGKVAFGNQINSTRLNAAFGPRSLNLIDNSSSVRVWRYTNVSNAAQIELIHGTNDDPYNGNAFFVHYAWSSGKYEIADRIAGGNNGHSRFLIDSSGNVGLGNAGTYDTTVSDYPVVVNSSGNVGIGTSSPQSGLHVVNGNVAFGDGGNAEVRLYGVGTEGDTNYERLTQRYDSGNTAWEFDSEAGGTGTVRDFAFSGGNVGIGTSSPSANFHLAGSPAVVDDLSLITAFTPSNGFARFAWWDPATPDRKFAFGSGYGDNSRFGINIKNSGNFKASTERLSILNTGEVGIGTTSPDYLLDVAGEIGFAELSSDPSNPDEGEAVFWMGDGTGTGNDGDILYKRTFAAATSTDFLPLSSGTTGGTGSAGAGNQYVEIEINGSVYKVLHDGTV